MAVCPITAESITADTNGLDAGEVPTADGVETPGYRAMPLKGKTFPVVLVVEEMFGVHERI
jgi:carboxymethylenebutenolidase